MSYRMRRMRSLRTEQLLLVLLLPLVAGCAGLRPEPRFRGERIPSVRPVRPAGRVQTTEWQRSLALELRRYLGAPYVWGGASPAGVDCSGLVVAVYGAALGLDLPHSVRELLKAGRPVGRSELRPGDLVFFRTSRRGPDHVGIYLGQDKFAHASPRRGVVISSLRSPYYARRWVASRRVVEADRERLSAGGGR